MQSIWKRVYEVEIAASFSVLLSLALPWHTEHGTGIATLSYGFSREAAMVVLSYGVVVIYLSSWMLLAFIPLLALLFGIRAALGVMTLRLSNDSILRLLVVVMAASTLWFWQANPDAVASGFWVCALSVVLLSLAILVEFSLPIEKIHGKRSIRDLMAEVYVEGFISCPHCGAVNDDTEDFCLTCGGWLGKE